MISTPWGYDIDAEQLEPIIDADQFAVITGGAFSASPERVTAVLNGVSSAIRDYCGWHVAPSLPCIFRGNGEGRLMMLPAMGVSDVEAVCIMDGEVTGEILPENQYQWTAAGMVRLTFGRFPDTWRGVLCEYTAGFNSASLGVVVAQIAGNALAASPGVSDERAGGVSISYNRTGEGITGGVSLLPRDVALLAPYRLTRAR